VKKGFRAGPGSFLTCLNTFWTHFIKELTILRICDIVVTSPLPIKIANVFFHRMGR
jgi:hypothetical protein